MRDWAIVAIAVEFAIYLVWVFWSGREFRRGYRLALEHAAFKLRRSPDALARIRHMQSEVKA